MCKAWEVEGAASREEAAGTADASMGRKTMAGRVDPLLKYLEDVPARPGRSSASGRFWLAASMVLIVVAGALLLWIWSQQSEKRAIQALPVAERQSLYRRTLEDLQSVCASRHASDLDRHCERQARFILQFPECDDGCRRLAQRQLRMPTR